MEESTQNKEGNLGDTRPSVSGEDVERDEAAGSKKHEMPLPTTVNRGCTFMWIQKLLYPAQWVLGLWRFPNRFLPGGFRWALSQLFKLFQWLFTTSGPASGRASAGIGLPPQVPHWIPFPFANAKDAMEYFQLAVHTTANRTTLADFDQLRLRAVRRHIQQWPDERGELKATALLLLGRIFSNIFVNAPTVPPEFDFPSILDSIDCYRAASMLTLKALEAAEIHYDLGMALFSHFRVTGNPVILLDALKSMNLALQGRLANTSGTPIEWVRQMALALRFQWEVTGDFVFLQTCVISLEGSVAQYDLQKKDGQAEGGNEEAYLACMLDLSRSLVRQFDITQEIEALDRPVELAKMVVDRTAEGHPSYFERGNNLVEVLFARYCNRGQTEDLNLAFSTGQKLFHAIPMEHPCKRFAVNNYANLCLSAFESSNNIEVLKLVIELYEKVLAVTFHYEPWFKGKVLYTLGTALRYRYQVGGRDVADLDWSISSLEGSIALIPGGHHDKLLDKVLRSSGLGYSLEARFIKSGSLDDLNRSISLEEFARQNTTPNARARHWKRTSDLADRVFTRCSLHQLDRNDLHWCIALREDVVQILDSTGDDRKRLEAYRSLGAACHQSFHQWRDRPEDYQKAVEFFQKALDLTSHMEGAERLHHLTAVADALELRFDEERRTEDLERAIKLKEEALELCQTPEDKVVVMTKLTEALYRRFRLSNKLEDIERCIDLQRSALDLDLTAVDHGGPFTSQLWHRLGMSLKQRSDLFGGVADLVRSVDALRKAFKILSSGHINELDYLLDFCDGLYEKYTVIQHATDGDIDEAIEGLEGWLGRNAKGSPRREKALDSLAVALIHRSSKQLPATDSADVERAIHLLREALSLCGQENIKSKILTNIGNCFNHVAIRSKRRKDFDSAIEYYQQAFELFNKKDNADAAEYLTQIGWAYLRRSNSSPPAREDVEKARTLFMDAGRLPSLGTRARIKIEKAEAHSTASLGVNALPVYRRLMETTLEYLRPGLPFMDRYARIMDLGMELRNSVAAAVEEEELQLAWEWADLSRAIVSTQLLQLRTPLDDLSETRPDLVREFQRLSRALEAGGREQFATSMQSRSADQVPPKSVHVLDREREVVLRKIRELEGFEEFLLPKSFEKLRSAAQEGLVVLINVAEARCDALVLSSDHSAGITHVSLPKFSFKEAQSMKTRLQGIIKATTVFRYRNEELEQDGGDERGLKPMGRKKSDASVQLSAMLSLLFETVAQPIINALSLDARSLDGQIDHRPRVWWCLTGDLAALPFHASGIYSAEGQCARGQRLSDYVVSSYTPNLQALIRCHEKKAHSQPEILVVALPSISKLPGTGIEVDDLCSIVGHDYSGLRVLLDSQATAEQVKEAMQTSNWAHFACHAFQVNEPSDPTESSLMLADGTLLSLADIMHLDSSKAEFAFLSACQTAQGHEILVDEDTHLSSGMLVAGYRGVVGTMWSIDDSIAPKVAKVVYERIWGEGNADSSRAARALDEAVDQLRRDGGSMLAWVPFKHIGV